jgi:hypothetical protein
MSKCTTGCLISFLSVNCELNTRLLSGRFMFAAPLYSHSKCYTVHCTTSAPPYCIERYRCRNSSTTSTRTNLWVTCTVLIHSRLPTPDYEESTVLRGTSTMIDEAKLLGPITIDHQASSATASTVPGLTYECRRDLGTFCSTILQNNSMIGSETGNGKKLP